REAVGGVGDPIPVLCGVEEFESRSDNFFPTSGDVVFWPCVGCRLSCINVDSDADRYMVDNVIAVNVGIVVAPLHMRSQLEGPCLCAVNSANGLVVEVDDADVGYIAQDRFPALIGNTCDGE